MQYATLDLMVINPSVFETDEAFTRPEKVPLLVLLVLIDACGGNALALSKFDEIFRLWFG